MRRSSIRSFALTHDAPVEIATIGMFLDLLRSQQGERILRMKGIVWVSQDEARPVVVHGVGALLHPPVRLEARPGGKRETRIVIIGDGHERGALVPLDRVAALGVVDHLMRLPGFDLNVFVDASNAKPATRTEVWVRPDASDGAT